MRYVFCQLLAFKAAASALANKAWHMRQQQQQRRQPRRPTQDQLQLQARLLQLLPLVVSTAMHAAARSAESRAADWEVCCKAVVTPCMGLLSTLTLDFRLSGKVCAAACPQPALLAVPPAVWLEQMLHDFSRLGRRVLEFMYPAASDSSGSSASAAAPTAAAFSFEPRVAAAGKNGARWLLMLSVTLQHVCAAVGVSGFHLIDTKPEVTAALQQLQQQQEGSGVEANPAEVWACLQKHTAAFASIVEGMVRCVATARARGELLDADDSRDFGIALKGCSGPLVVAGLRAGPSSNAWRSVCSLIRSCSKLGFVVDKVMGDGLSLLVMFVIRQLLQTAAAAVNPTSTAATTTASAAAGPPLAAASTTQAWAPAGTNPVLHIFGGMCLWIVQHF